MISAVLTATVRSEDSLANRPGLLEAEISLPAVHRLADDHVIKHLDLENPGSFIEPPSQTKISFARTRVAGYAACGIMQSSFRSASRRERLENMGTVVAATVG